MKNGAKKLRDGGDHIIVSMKHHVRLPGSGFLQVCMLSRSTIADGRCPRMLNRGEHVLGNEDHVI